MAAAPIDRVGGELPVEAVAWLLQVIAKEDKNGMGAQALAWLEKGTAEVRDWPRPAKGTLPKGDK